MENKLILTNQTNLMISGVKKALGISETHIVLELDNNSLQISGQTMEVKKLDVESGILEVEGKIISIRYIQEREKLNFFKRIFK